MTAAKPSVVNASGARRSRRTTIENLWRLKRRERRAPIYFVI